MNELLTCREVDDLLPGYALDALVEEERCNFLAHLAECRLHDDELAGYRSVTSRLPEAIDPVEPPSKLRAGLLSSFDAMIAGEAAPPIPASVARPRLRLIELVRRPAFAYGLAAAFLVLALGLGVFGLSSSGGDNDVQQVTYSQQGMSLKLAYLAKERLAVFEADMAPLPAGRVYQAWQMIDGKPVSIGVFNGNGVTAFETDLSRATHIAVSVEPPGGSAAPTTTPILVTEI